MITKMITKIINKVINKMINKMIKIITYYIRAVVAISRCASSNAVCHQFLKSSLSLSS